MENQERAQAVPLFQNLGKFWTAANILSLSRAVLALPATYLIVTGVSLFDGAAGTWLFVLMMLMILSDWFDGQVARWSNTVSNWGKVLDPIADKFAATAVIVALVIRGSLPVWLLGFILVRDVVLVLGAMFIRQSRHGGPFGDGHGGALRSRSPGARFLHLAHRGPDALCFRALPYLVPAPLAYGALAQGHSGKITILQCMEVGGCGSF